MKKAIILSFVLCFSLLSTKHIKPLVFATPSDKTSILEQNNLTKENEKSTVEQNDSTQEIEKPTVKQNDSTQEIEKPTVEQNDSTQEIEKPTVEQNNSTQEIEKPTVEQNNSTQEDEKPTVEQNVLTQQEAKNVLIKYNNKVNYIYQGTEHEFEALKSKNLEGYVFLPDVETDIGFFVDKKTHNIYFFHPSGYLELAQ